MLGKRQRKHRGEVGEWCTEWAKQRRFALGIDRSIEPWEQLGQMRSTLAKVREDGEGASYSAKISQRFPEVYRGDSLDVHRAIMALPGKYRFVIHLHYVWYEVRAEHKCFELGVSVSRYWVILREAKESLSRSVLGKVSRVA